MRKCVELVILSLCFAGLGCQGLTQGKMEWVQTTSDKPRAGNVYLVRGLIGVFSTGMDELQAKLDSAGVRAHVFQDAQHAYLADELIKTYKNAKDPEPLVLIGHSYGADDVVTISRKLAAHNIPVDLLVTVDATTPPKVPGNVAVCYNYFQSQITDGIPMFRGIPLEQDEPAKVKLTNINLRKDRTDLLMPGTNHINIDKNTRVHSAIVEQVLESCPTRQAWVSRQGRGASPAAPKINAVSDGSKSPPARHVQGASPNE